MKNYTMSDTRAHGCIAGALSLMAGTTTELVYAPLPWQKAGLQESRTGYGGRLNSGYKICFEGRLYRVYVTCYSNAASHWFAYRGQRIFVA